MKTLRNLVIFNAALFLVGWYLWGVRYNLDVSPMVFGTVVLVVNTVLGWWVYPRHQNASYYLLGSAGFILILNLILLRGLVSLR